MKLELIHLIVALFFYILTIILGSIKKGILGFILTLVFPFAGAVIVALLPSDNTCRERERESNYFKCNICHIKYPESLLGGKTEYEGMICKYCMEKEHKEKN